MCLLKRNIHLVIWQFTRWTAKNLKYLHCLIIYERVDGLRPCLVVSFVHLHTKLGPKKYHKKC